MGKSLLVLCIILMVALVVVSKPPPSIIHAASATSFWYANMNHTGKYAGYAPCTDTPSTYSVYVAVAAGDGPGIQVAINSAGTGSRHALWLASQPRVVYIPPGTYTVSKTIEMNTDTILMGDATNPPIIKAASGFSGNILITGQDPKTGVSGEISFAVGLKNLILDTTNIPGGNAFTALWWGVAQACQLQNIVITMPASSNGNGHSGIQLGRGSTLGVSDVRIEKGQNGIWHNGHQQVLYKNIYFYQNTVGVLISGGATISIFSPTFDTCGVGVQVTGGSPWVALVDGVSKNSGITFMTSVYPSFIIENLSKDTNSDIVQMNGNTVLGPQSHVNTFTYANTVGRNPIYGATTSTNTRPAALAPGGKYPVVAAPNFASNTAADFINVKDPLQNGNFTVHGDNSADDSAALNGVLKHAAGNKKIAYFPFGVYRVLSTVTIPAGSRLVGEAWSTITGDGSYFQDASNPKPVVSVGNPGDVGVAQLQDFRFAVSSVLPGAIVIQFNIAGSSPGDVALWNSLVTIGGTRCATGLTNACSSASNECRGAFLGIHLAPTSSAYIENVWNWVADHITEDIGGGSNIAGHGGVLIQSTKASWLHALGSEHWWLYQLNIFQASNVLVSLLQSETNYDQGDNTQQTPPAPWTANTAAWGDPDFSWCGGSDKRCRMGYANFINGGSNIYTYASASWAFFSGPGYQGCAGAYQCQDVMHWIQKLPTNLQAFGLCSKDTYVTLREANGTEIVTQNGFTGSWSGAGGDVGRYTP